jgi:hypothetical protein
MTDPQQRRRVPCRRKSSRAAIARANGARSRGPATEAGRRRSSLNALVHGPRARRHVAVVALGEDSAERDAHFAAVRAELGAESGPIARHLTETAAASSWRSARAERLEGELLEAYRLFHRLNAQNGRTFWQRRSPEEHAAMRALEAREGGPASVSELPPDDGNEAGRL